MKCLSNIEKNNKDAVIKAIAESEDAIEWRDEPDERLPKEKAADFGSVWSSQADCSRFWECYRRISSIES